MRKLALVLAELTGFSWGMAAVHGAATLGITPIAAGLSRPLFVTAPPGDTNRLFVLEQHAGRIRILDLTNPTSEPATFLTINGVTTQSEQGLLGLAFHPGYATNGQFYVNYTTTGGGSAGHTEVARYQAQGDPLTSKAADPGSRGVVLTFDQPQSNHNGGWLGFGLDGFLYISAGDGGGGDDQHGSPGNGQGVTTLLAKVLRIDVNNGTPYGIPDGNPFKGDSTKKEEIWAYGLRNPWRCSIDRLTGDLWIGDVGQNTREEVDFNPAGVGGLNFGWRAREGTVQNPAYPNQQPLTPATEPVHDYGRSTGFSITGGYVYRGSAIPSLQGYYLFADYGSGRIWSFQYDGTNQVDFAERTAELNPGNPKTIRGISSFGEDANGELYICGLTDGVIYRIISTEPLAIRLSGAEWDGQAFAFQFTAEPGQRYVIEWRDSLLAGDWQTYQETTAASSIVVMNIPAPAESTARFYRVRVP